MKIEYWNSPYGGAKSELARTEEWPDTEESFVKFYDANNSLKYCNGSHYIIVDKDVCRLGQSLGEDKVLEFVDKQEADRYSVFDIFTHRKFNSVNPTVN